MMKWIAILVAMLLPPLLAGCDWVDSTGRQADDAPMLGEQITLDDTPLGSANEIVENTTVRVVVARAGSRDPSFDYRFETDATDSGALDACLAFEAFDADDAAGSLDEACSSDEACVVDVQRNDAEPGAEHAFELTTPVLRAPIGLSYRLVTGQRVVDENGESTFVADDERDVILCLLSVNDPPVAVDDSYAVLAGDTLDVSVADGLLQNDEDDDDVSNGPLRVLNEQVQPPPGAARFELFSDGSFVFESDDPDSREDRSVAFTYTVTDSVARDVGPDPGSSATVRLRIVAANEAPMQTASLPTVTGTVGEPLSFDFAEFFVDPEGAPLTYSFDSSLPDDGDLALSDDGLLAGVPQADDVGEYLLDLFVDDGGFGTEVRVALVIEDVVVDQPPVYVAGSVSDRTVSLGNRITPVRPRFEDPEGGPLSYTSVGTALPVGLVLDPDDGSVSGRPRQRGLTTGLVIQARDVGGLTARSDPFSVRVF